MPISITSPNTTSSNLLELVFGDDYYNADNRAIAFELTGFPVMTGATVIFCVDKSGTVLTFPCTVVDTDTIMMELTAAQIATIGVGYWRYDLQATLSNTHVVTIVKSGLLSITADIR